MCTLWERDPSSGLNQYFRGINHKRGQTGLTFLEQPSGDIAIINMNLNRQGYTHFHSEIEF